MHDALRLDWEDEIFWHFEDRLRFEVLLRRSGPDIGLLDLFLGPLTCD